MNMHHSFERPSSRNARVKERSERIRRGPTGTILQKADKAPVSADPPADWQAQLSRSTEAGTNMVSADKTVSLTPKTASSVEEWEPDPTEADLEASRLAAYEAVNARNGLTKLPTEPIVYPKQAHPELSVVNEDGYQRHLAEAQRFSVGKWAQQKASSFVRWVRFGSYSRDIEAH